MIKIKVEYIKIVKEKIKNRIINVIILWIQKKSEKITLMRKRGGLHLWWTTRILKRIKIIQVLVKLFCNQEIYLKKTNPETVDFFHVQRNKNLLFVNNLSTTESLSFNLVNTKLSW